MSRFVIQLQRGKQSEIKEIIAKEETIDLKYGEPLLVFADKESFFKPYLRFKVGDGKRSFEDLPYADHFNYIKWIIAFQIFQAFSIIILYILLFSSI